MPGVDKGEAAEASSVTWTVEGKKDSGTTISEAGLLTIGEDEIVIALTVKAASKTNSKLTASVSVAVEAVYTLSPSSGSVYKGETTQFAVTRKGVAVAATDYDWSVAGAYENYGDNYKKKDGTQKKRI